jgi:excisionase family DNA binding protein
MLTAAEVAAVLKLDVTTIYQLCEAKKIRHSRFGIGRGVIRIEEAALEEYKKSCEIPARDASEETGEESPTRRTRRRGRGQVQAGGFRLLRAGGYKPRSTG